METTSFATSLINDKELGMIVKHISANKPDFFSRKQHIIDLIGSRYGRESAVQTIICFFLAEELGKKPAEITAADVYELYEEVLPA